MLCLMSIKPSGMRQFLRVERQRFQCIEQVEGGRVGATLVATTTAGQHALARVEGADQRGQAGEDLGDQAGVLL